MSEILKCKVCGTREPLSLVDPEKILIDVKKNLVALGVNLEDLRKHEKEMIGCCDICAEVAVYRAVLTETIERHTSKKHMGEIEKLLDAAIEAARETTWMSCKKALLDEIHAGTKSRMVWRLFIKLCNWPEQPQHVSDAEAGLMRSLHDRGYSLSVLAYIFNRSKETVHRHLHASLAVAS